MRTAKLAKREKTRDVANEKAMRTLRIKKGDAKDLVEPMQRPEPASGAPAPKNASPDAGKLYRELMTKAGRPAMSMYDGAIKASETLRRRSGRRQRRGFSVSTRRFPTPR